MKSVNLVRSVALSLLLFISTSALAASAAQPTGAVPGRFVVKLKPQAKASLIQAALSTDGTFERFSKLQIKPILKGAEIWNRYYVYTASKTDVTLATATAAIGANNIENIEPDYYLEFFGYPTDSLFPNQWGLRNVGQDYLGIDRRDGVGNDVQILKHGVAGNDIHISTYYEHPPAETSKVIVAIVDTGVDLKHPELKGRLWKNPDEIPHNGIDDDHNGFVDDTLGYDVSGDTPNITNPVGDNDPTDVEGHGTHLAGIVASDADGLGIVGVAPWAQIMAVKIRPNATNAVGAAGILYAVNSGAQVINVSWGTPFEALVLKDALDFARANGVFVSIAAGNSGTDTQYYPAAFDSAFAVAAGNSSGFMTSFSTFGPQIKLVAPGQDILSLRAAGTDLYASAGEPGVHIVGPDSLYYLADGTSMAAPMVAGAAALMLSFRPDLTLQQLERLLEMGAIDMVDPRNVGDTLPGPDTISGYGYINVENSLNILTNGGVSFAQPIRRNRYLGPVPITIKPVAGYNGGWKLEYGVGLGPSTWTELASGVSMPPDSVVITFNQPTVNGYVTLRLTDDFANQITTNFEDINSEGLKLTSPLTGDTVKYNALIHGSAYGPDFDSMTVSFMSSGKAPVRLLGSTSEFFDTLLFTWEASGSDTGSTTIYLRGYFAGHMTVDSAIVDVASTYSAGWPKALPGRGSYTPVCGDINGDGHKEVIVGTSAGMFAFNADGTLVSNFPVYPDKDMRCVPAIYDVDGDGKADIVCTSDDGIHVIRYDGTEAAGWPKACFTGLLSYGYPNPAVIKLRPNEEPSIVMVNNYGRVLAYHLNGDSYFYSLGGYYTTFNPGASTGYGYGGNLVASADLVGDSTNQVVVSYSAIVPRSGTAVFDGRTGQPAYDRANSHVVDAQVVYGTVLADLNGDGLPEVVTCGYDQTLTRTIWVKTMGVNDLPGWPIRLPEMAGWRGNYPTVADLDRDGVPEVLCTFFEYDIGVLYIFKADGTPYVNRPGRPYGEAYRGPVTFGIPMVADLVGDDYPEIVFRTGYILPSTGTEKIYLLDHNANLIPGWPISTSAPTSRVVSSPYAPMVDDIKGNGKVQMVLTGDAYQIFMWDFDRPSNNGTNRARLLADNNNSGIYTVNLGPTDVPGDGHNLPAGFELSQNYPNPFNPTTTISFTLPRKSRVTLEVFNILGQQVKTLVNDELVAGSHQVTFDGGQMASGIYMYRLTTDTQRETKKMVLVK